MIEHDETLKNALEDNARLRREHADSLREASATQFSARYRWAERLYWLYAIACVLVILPAIYAFVGSRDTKWLIGSAVVILVVYETTVLLKLWIAMVGMKMSVLKDIKLLRLEVAQLASAAGVTDRTEPSVRYQPMRGASRLERVLWIAACVMIGMATSAWLASGMYFGAGQLSADSLITLASDGSATSVTDTTQTWSSLYPGKTFPFHLPKQCEVRWVDPKGQEMSYEIRPAGTHHRYDVAVTDSALDGGNLKCSRITQNPQAATLHDGVWTYQSDIMYSVPQNRLKITVCLPVGARVVSVEPTPVLEFEKEGRRAIRFEALRGKNEKFAYKVRYEFASTSDD